MDEADVLAGNAASDELAAELVVGVPLLARGAEIAEDNLQRPGDRRRVGASGVAVDVVAVLAPDLRDPVGGYVELGGGGGRLAADQGRART